VSDPKIVRLTLGQKKIERKKQTSVCVFDTCKKIKKSLEKKTSVKRIIFWVRRVKKLRPKIVCLTLGLKNKKKLKTDVCMVDTCKIKKTPQKTQVSDALFLGQTLG